MAFVYSSKFWVNFSTLSGDLWSYNEETKQFVVSPEPDVSVRLLTEQDFCLVIGSDGITNVINPQHVAEIVHRSERDCDLAVSY